MEEFIGLKVESDKEGFIHPTQEYVEWLEGRLAELTKQLSVARSTIASMKAPLIAPRRLNVDDDYIPYPDEGDDR